jgi:hypothetical protein
VTVLAWWQVPVGWWCWSPRTSLAYRFDGWLSDGRALLSGVAYPVPHHGFVRAAEPALYALMIAFPGSEIIEVEG